NSKAIIVDPGDEWERIRSVLDKNKLKPEYIILTHGHVDHIKDTKAISSYYHIGVFIHKDEKELLSSSFNNLSATFGIKVDSFTIERYLKDGQIIQFEGEELKVIHTPGHTPGGICIKGKDFLISGDTLFADSRGRTDLPGGDEDQLIRSITEKLFKLEDNLKVYPGHNMPTSIGHEKANWGIL
ncbi:MAG: MBL fold metallo-hydrolase, partial [Spirochaetes bacterium]|nr:MBL fold metallo-hydrolase [Spirochaetota bacterium]